MIGFLLRIRTIITLLFLVIVALTACNFPGFQVTQSPDIFAAATSTPTLPPEDDTIRITIHDASIPEGHESTSIVEVVVELILAATETVSVQWSTKDDSAKANEDYVEASGELSFNPGETSKVIQVSVIGDMQYADDEADEQFQLILKNPVNAEISDAESLVTIVNDDKSLADSYSDLHRDLNGYVHHQGAILSDHDTVFTSKILDVDLDDDGDLDIILLSSTAFSDPDGSNQEIVIFRNLKGAGFTQEEQIITADARDVAIQDFNGDGRTDIFLADHGLDIPPYPGGQDRLLLQNNSGYLIDATESSWPDKQLFSHSACEGDIDSDGDFDINVSTGGVQLLYINDGTGTFVNESSSRLPLQQISGYVYQATTNVFMQSLWDLQFYWCEMADINLDGAIDLILGDHNIPTSTDSDGNIIGNSHLLLLNDGTGVFHYSYPNSLIPNAVLDDNATVEMKSFDVNLDHCIDLATVTTNYVGDQVVAMFLNDCSGNLSLSDEHHLTNVWWTDIMFVLDVNGDQLDDLVTAYVAHTNFTRPVSARSGELVSGGRAYINNGDGTFQERKLLPADLYRGGPGLYLALRAAGVED